MRTAVHMQNAAKATARIANSVVTSELYPGCHANKNPARFLRRGSSLYGLADVLEQLGRLDEARVHWRAYLQNEPAGECADYVRSRLATQTG